MNYRQSVIFPVPDYGGCRQSWRAEIEVAMLFQYPYIFGIEQHLALAESARLFA